MLAMALPPSLQLLFDGAVAATQLVNSFNIAVFPVSPPAGDPAVTVTQAVQTFGGDQEDVGCRLGIFH